MKECITKEEMMKKVMQTAHLFYRMRERYSWTKGRSWADCLCAAWESNRLRYFVRKRQKAVRWTEPEVYNIGVDLSCEYGHGDGHYCGD